MVDFSTDGGYFTGSGNVIEHSSIEPRSLHFTWTSSCLLGALPDTDATGSVAQLLTLRVDRVNGSILEEPVGFRLSFRNLPVPQLLRLSSLANETNESESSDNWRDPPAHLRIDISRLVDSLATQTDTTQDSNAIEHEIEQLRILQAQAKELRSVIRTKQTIISHYLGNDVFSLGELVDQCDSIGCVLKAFVHKADGVIKVMYARLSHGHKKPQAYMATDTNRHWNESRAFDPSSLEDSAEDNTRSGLSQGIIIALGAVAAVLGCGCVLIALRHCCCCRCPRRKVERLADRQERHAARAYRRAARRQRWRDWWHGRDPRITDYEQKRALILEQEGLLEEAMQDEIRQLQDTHEVVNGILRAHDPHFSIQRQSSSQHVVQQASRRSSNASDGFLPPLSRTSSLPSYTTDPRSEGLPEYDDHGGEIDTVANGFSQYTPTSSSDHQWTPGSSIIDVSPRQSTETMRTKYEEQANDEHDDDDQNQDRELEPRQI
ncbi:MAG: hypothetical protein M1821_008131 [Bathelium mastoideum]|nr:MAG: hypothetical protein M1821_008131 [Bathelium mastoideum]